MVNSTVYSIEPAVKRAIEIDTNFHLADAITSYSIFVELSLPMQHNLNTDAQSYLNRAIASWIRPTRCFAVVAKCKQSF